MLCSRSHTMRRSRLVLSTWLTLLSQFFAAACGGDQIFSPGRSAEVSRLWIGSTGLVLDPGATERFGLRAGDGASQVLYEMPATSTHSWPGSLVTRWTSSDPNTVAIDDSGRITARRAGRVHMYVSVNGIEDSATVAVNPVPGATTIEYESLAVGAGFTCGRARTGKTFCWGSNWWGQLATGKQRLHTAHLSPVMSAKEQAFIAVTAGARHACGLTAEGSTFCWGNAANGKLGDPTIDWTESRATPVPLKGGVVFERVVAGVEHNCGLDNDQVAYCWGLNDYGQLGDGTVGAGRSRAEPRPVKTDLRFSAIAPGLDHTCALTNGGKAYCWGRNGDGQLGTGGFPPLSAVPVPVAIDTIFGKITAGVAHTCGLATGGTAYCWGRNWYGQLGIGSLSGGATPVAVAGDLAFMDISAGGDHTCALETGGMAYCWGSNWRGYLGNNFDFASKNYTAEDLIQRTPTPVTTSLRFVAIGASRPSQHTCALATDGSAHCWGDGTTGSLGIGRIPRVAGTNLAVQPAPARVAPLF